MKRKLSDATLPILLKAPTEWTPDDIARLRADPGQGKKQGTKTGEYFYDILAKFWWFKILDNNVQWSPGLKPIYKAENIRV